jgi:AAA+ ATPase superfamily predicted ATPase
MEALLEDRAAPLYNRTTHDLQLQHLDISTIIEILKTHASPAPERLLFLWNLFEGVPKFYRDCFEQNALSCERSELIARMFFGGSSPLRNEADNWFLKELRGRYDLVLKYIARHPGCSHADLIAYVREVSPLSQEQVSGYLQALEERFMMIENRQPFGVKPQSRRRRYYVSDNFLRCWLAAIAPEIAAVNFRPLPELVSTANRRLFDAEGSGMEKLVRTLYEERSRKGRGDLHLSQRAVGYWDKAETEIDVVAVDETHRVLRLLSCKRSADKLTTDHLLSFDKHIDGFLKRHPMYHGWTLQKYAVAPWLESTHRQVVRSSGYIPEDLEDLCDGL